MTTLQELYEHFDAKIISYKVIVGGADVSILCDSVDWTFDISNVPTATLEIPVGLLVPAISEEASVEIWVGFQLGMISVRAQVFGEGIVSSVSADGPLAQIECVQDGARRLTVPYYKQIDYNFDNVTAQASVIAMLTLAGVTNFVVDLDAWDIGTAVPQKLQFSNYGEAVNKVSEVDGSPWFCMPTGQIRVEKRDPLPYDTPARIYYGANLLGTAEVHPSLSDASLRPRVIGTQKAYDRAGVANFIEVDGAVLVTVGPNGEQNSEQITETVDGASGTFANGAPWIPTPPLFQPFTLQNELIDTDAKANAVATRYFNLKNRLIQNVSVNVPLDPLLFLAMTCRIIDPEAEVDGLYYLKSYRCSIGSGQATSELTLLGGPYAGTQGHAAPFAEFIWNYESFYSQLPGSNPTNGSRLNLGWQTGLGSKLIQDLPANTGSPDQGGNLTDGKQMVMITYDGSPSRDFDGSIVQYFWLDDQGNTQIGANSRFTVMYDPDIVSSVNMTLTVTDDTARTDAITKNVYTAADAPPSPLPDDPTLDDTPFGGGQAAGDTTIGGSPTKHVNGPGGKNGMALVYFIAADCVMMATANNRDYNSINASDLGTGAFISVGMSSDYQNSQIYAVFGTDEGELVLTKNGCQTADIVKVIPGRPAVTSILFDTEELYRVWAGTEDGQIWFSSDSGQTWSKFYQFPDRSIINKLLTLGSSLIVFGGDTGSINTLVRYAKRDTTAFVSLTFSPAMQAAINAAGTGFSISAAAVSQQKLLVGFSGGVSPIAWSASNPISDPSTWAATNVTGSQVLAAAPGFDGKLILSTDNGIFRTLDGEDFTLGDSGPVNDIAWEGLDGVYIGLKTDSLTKTVDDGNTQGDMIPNPDFANEGDWPDCAIGHQVAVAVVPRDDDLGHWPAPGPPPLTWVSLGFNGSHPTWNGGVGKSGNNPLTGVVDMVATLIGTQTRPGVDDSSPTITEFYYMVSATGPSPSATGLTIQWYNATGPVSVASNIVANFQAVVDSCLFPASTPKNMIADVSVALPDNTYAGYANTGASSINTTGTALSFWGGATTALLGPQADPTIINEATFSNFNFFPPHVNGYVFTVGVGLQIVPL